MVKISSRLQTPVQNVSKLLDFVYKVWKPKTCLVFAWSWILAKKYGVFLRSRSQHRPQRGILILATDQKWHLGHCIMKQAWSIQVSVECYGQGTSVCIKILRVWVIYYHYQRGWVILDLWNVSEVVAMGTITGWFWEGLSVTCQYF